MNFIKFNLNNYIQILDLQVIITEYITDEKSSHLIPNSDYSEVVKKDNCVYPCNQNHNKSILQTFYMIPNERKDYYNYKIDGKFIFNKIGKVIGFAHYMSNSHELQCKPWKIELSMETSLDMFIPEGSTFTIKIICGILVNVFKPRKKNESCMNLYEPGCMLCTYEHDDISRRAYCALGLFVNPYDKIRNFKTCNDSFCASDILTICSTCWLNQYCVYKLETKCPVLKCIKKKGQKRHLV